MKIEQMIDRGYYWIDDGARKTALALARRISRRNFLSRLGMMLAGAASLPLLPVSRAFAQNSLILRRYRLPAFPIATAAHSNGQQSFVRIRVLRISCLVRQEVGRLI